MSIDFTKMPGTSNPQGVPSWLDSLFGIKKTASVKTAFDEELKEEDMFPQDEEKEEALDKKPIEEEDGMEKDEEGGLSKEDIEEMLTSKDPMAKVHPEEEKELVMASRIDPMIRPYSRAAQEKIAGHWAGDTPEEIKKAEGDVVNDGDKVRLAEESKFEEEAGNTAQRLVKENHPRNSIWEVTEGKKAEASTKGQIKTASTDKFASLNDDGKLLWKDFYKVAFDYVTKEGKDNAEKIAESYAWKKIAKATDKDLEKAKAKKEKEKAKEKAEKEKEKEKAEKEKAKEKAEKEKEKEKAKKEKEKAKEKKADTDDDRETKLAVRAYRRNLMLQKLAKKEDEGYGSHKTDVQFQESWYDEIIGAKKNIGNVREAEVEGGVEKEASADVGLDFSYDPKPTGEYGAGGDFKVNDVYDENSEVMKGDVEKEPLDSANYSKEYGTTRKSSDERMSKSAHYNNRTMGMDDDGPTAPQQQDDGRDTFLRTWWTDQVKKSQQFLDKEYRILGDGKKEMHTDAIPVFKDKASKEAFITNRRMQREAMVGKVAASGEGSDKAYYAKAYGDAGFASKMFDNYGVKKVATTLEERAALRNKIAGLGDGMVKTAFDLEGMITSLALPAIKTLVMKELDKHTDPLVQAVAPFIKSLIMAGNIQGLSNALTNEKNISVKNAIQGIIDAAKASGSSKPIDIAGAGAEAAPVAEAPVAAGAGLAEALPEAAMVAASNDLQMRKQARMKLAQTYGEPVKEPDSSKVGSYDWDASDLSRNAIVDAPQSMVIKQLEQSIANVRGALKGKK